MSVLGIEASSMTDGTPSEGPTLPAVLAPVVLSLLLSGVDWKILRATVAHWWDDPNYSHGCLVPLFSLYLVSRQWGTLRTLPRTGSWLGIPVILFGIMVLLVGDFGADNFLM